jgi:hypothetical protein
VFLWWWGGAFGVEVQECFAINFHRPRPFTDPVQSPNRPVNARSRHCASRKAGLAVRADAAGAGAAPATGEQQQQQQQQRKAGGRQQRAPRTVSVKLADIQPGQEYEGTVVCC